MSKQSYSENLANLNGFSWTNANKLVLGSVMKQFLLNWLDSFAEGVLDDGTTIQEAITALRKSIGTDSSGALNSESFSKQFKFLDNVVWWDPSYFAAQYSGQVVTEDAYTYYQLVAANALSITPLGLFKLSTAETISGVKVKCEFDIKLVSGSISNSDKIRGRTYYGSNYLLSAVDVSLGETEGWQSVTLDLPSDDLSYTDDFAYYRISLWDTSEGDVIVDSGTTIQIRNVKLYDEENNEIAISEVATHSSIYWTFTTDEASEETTVDSDLTGTRVKHLVLTTTGQTPTMPLSSLTPYDDDWLSTDILVGEWAYNSADDIWYYNNGSEIKAFQVTSSTVTSLPNTWCADITEIRAITDYEEGQDLGIYATATIYEFVDSVTNDDDGDTYLKPDDIDSADAGRWVKRKTFVTEDSLTYTSQERFSLIGHTSIPTAFSSAASVIGVPKFTNLTSVKLVNTNDDSEIEIVTDSVVADLPIAVAAGDYTYELTYESGYEQGVLLINFEA